MVVRKRADLMGADQLADTLREVEQTGIPVVLFGCTYDEAAKDASRNDRIAIISIKDFEILRRLKGF